MGIVTDIFGNLYDEAMHLDGVVFYVFSAGWP